MKIETIRYVNQKTYLDMYTLEEAELDVVVTNVDTLNKLRDNALDKKKS